MKIVMDKPVVPKFIADYIEWFGFRYPNNSNLYRDLLNVPYEYTYWEKVANWSRSDFQNQEILFDAFRYGYTIEQEQLYTAKPKVASLSNWRNEGKNWLATDGELVWLSTNSKHGQTLETWNSVMVTQGNADFEKMED